MRLDAGVCVSCLLRKGLETGGEVSKVVYETVLDELDGRDKPWQLGNYEILEQIGCGGMGVIYRARQRHSRRIVAVKRVLSYRADSHGALQRFRREAQAVASLDHPNILPIYEVSESEDGLPFFSMKLAEKGSLHENAASLRDEPRRCVQLMAKVARAVEYAHSRGVLHRDIKPGNILLNDQGEPLVSDFGLAKLLDGNNDLTRSLTTFGTAGFIAPEQAGGAAADFTPAADVYSLGAVMFTVLAGRPPFLGSNPVSVIRQASETQAPKLRSLAPSLDRDLETICSRCLERDPKARYQSAGDLAADLERWLDGRPIIARPVSPPARIWRWSRRNPKLVGAATAGLVLGAAAVSLFHAEFFRASQINPPDKTVAVLPVSDASETKDQGYKLAVRPFPHEQPGSGVYDRYLQGLFTDVTHPTGVSGAGISVPVQNPSDPFTVPDYTSAGDFDLRRPDTRVTAAPAGTGFTTSVRDRALEAGPRTNKITADMLAAPPETGVITSVRDRVSGAGLRTNKNTADVPAAPPRTGVTTSVRDRASESGLRTNKITADGPAAPPGTGSITSVRDRVLEAGLRTNKITADVTGAPPKTGVTTSVRDRASESGLRTNKITADGPASIQGFVKDAKGEPIKGTDVRIESREGKQVSTVKTDSKGRYISQGLQPGVYRVTLLVNGAVKASIMNTQTKANQPTQLNFELKPPFQAGNIAKGGKHMVWVPNRTGSHIGGNWVEVDDEGNPHFDSNIQTYNVRR
jgi:serine/threonine protein kinase